MLIDGNLFIVECLIWVIGCCLNIDNIGLENIQIDVIDKGLIMVDKYQNMMVDGVYVVGDIMGQFEFILVVVKVGCLLSECLFNQQYDVYLDYVLVLMVVFSYLFIGIVGLIEVEVEV